MSATVIFYSAIKPADASAASGVARVAGLLIEALRTAGFDVATPGLPQTYEGTGDPARQRELRERAAHAATELLTQWRTPPAAWLTYHCYYKSPDVVGPAVSQALGCAYLIAEGSFARKRVIGPWAEHHRAAAAALAAADVLLAATPRDREGLEAVPGRRGAVVDFPPFVDYARFAAIERKPASGPVTILAAGSMADARKLDSYRLLFRALGTLPSGAAVVRIAGDGPGRRQLESESASLRANGIDVRFLGQLPQSAMPDFFASGDVFAWPGLGEAYGLTYLEAQAAGVPVVAARSGGVSACVADGVGGRLAEPDDFAKALRDVVDNPTRRLALGRSARTWIATERCLPVAAKRLRNILTGIAQ